MNKEEKEWLKENDLEKSTYNTEEVAHIMSKYYCLGHDEGYSEGYDAGCDE